MRNNISIIRMRTLFFCLGLLLICPLLQAQSPTPIPPESTEGYPTVDAARYTLKYRFNHKRNPKKNASKSQVLTLQIGEQYNRFYFEPPHNPLKQNLPKDVGLNTTGDGLASTVILLDKAAHQRSVSVRLSSGNANHFVYTEAETYPEWELLEDRQEILGYPCQMARGVYRGRSYTVWFTMDIPIAAGPWKLGGLPGLILRAEDERREFVFECIELKQTAKVAILGLNPRAQKKERLEIEKAIQHLHRNFGKILVAQGYHISIANKDGSLSDGSQISFVYNPIEKE